MCNNSSVSVIRIVHNASSNTESHIANLVVYLVSHPQSLGNEGTWRKQTVVMVHRWKLSWVRMHIVKFTFLL